MNNFNTKKGRKTEQKGTKDKWDNMSNTVDLNPTILIITLDIGRLNTPN